MKNKILAIGLLGAALSLIGGTALAQPGNGNAGAGTGSQVRQQLQTQVIDGSIATHTPIQTQQRLQDGTGTGSEARVQNKNATGTNTVQQKRSQVAEAVQEMLQVAERNGGIGQQVRIIAQNQTQNQEKIETGLNKIQGRGAFTRFFIGADYSEINNVKKLLDQNQEQIKDLNQLKGQIDNQDDLNGLNQQIEILNQANSEIMESLDLSQKGFSLFGWFVKMFK